MKFHPSQIIELSKRDTRSGSPRVSHSVSQPNPAHLFASQENVNPARPTTGWWIKQVGSLILKKVIFSILKKIKFLF